MSTIFKYIFIRISVLSLLFFFLTFLSPVSAKILPPNHAMYGFETCSFDGTFAADGTYTTVGSVLPQGAFPACSSVDTGELGFKIPSLGDLLTFAIRAFFVIAGLAALFYLLLGALGWVTSGGDKDAVTAAREKIQAAVVGMILIVAVLAIIWTLEQVIFNRRICLGLSCSLTLPGLIESQIGKNCCVCIADDGSFGPVINTYLRRCLKNDPWSAPL